MKPECYHAACMYSADGCAGCSHELDCYEHFLNYMTKENEK